MSGALIDIIEQINAAGYRVNNLFQLHVGGSAVLSWQCNVTNGDEFGQFVRGATMQEALERAFMVLPKVTDPFA